MEKDISNRKYGIENFGRLKSVMLHMPEEAIKLITEDNKGYFQFDKVPDVDKYLEEQQNYRMLLENHGVEVILLADHVTRNTDLLNRLPNLAYLHDIAAVSSFGSILSKMSSRGRCHEEIVVREALNDIGIPGLFEPEEGEDFEGCLLISPETVFVAETERHTERSINKFIGFILKYFPEVIYAKIPKERRFMHADVIFNRVSENLIIYYPQAFIKTYHITKDKKQEIDIKEFMSKRNVDMAAVSDEEQKAWGCSFVALEPGLIVNYDISLKQKTINLLEKEGVKFIHFHPDALLAGGGSLRCLTMRLLRERG